MKVSQFNIYDENYEYIANTLTGAKIEVSKEDIIRLREGKFKEFSIDEISILKEQGFIVDLELDELQLLRNAYNISKYNNKKVTITIAPSLNCNFNCAYCYEKKDSEFMDEMVQNDVIAFIKSILVENHISELNICWYGGEPILYVNIVSKLSTKLMAICSEIDVAYNASIITNGYLIDDKIIDLFKQCSINLVQVTVDGTQKTHDSRRRLVNGDGTYKKIKENIFLLAKNEINVVIRVNLDKSNVHEYKYVYDTFKKNKYISCYPGIVTVEDTQEPYQQLLCYQHKEYMDFYKELFKDMCEPIDYEDYKNVFKPSICNCAAEHEYSYIIAPDGQLYKCLNDICNNKFAIGNIKNGVCGIVSVAKYLGRDPFSEPECKECSYLPLCYGGCVYEYVKHSSHACKAVKFMYRKYCQSIPIENEI